MGAGGPAGQERRGDRPEGLDALSAAVTPGDYELNSGETAVVGAFYRGETARFGAKPGATIAAALIESLCVHAGFAAGGAPSGLRIEGARGNPTIEGKLDLRGQRIDFPLVLIGCALGEIDMTDARAVTVDLGGSTCASFVGGRMRVAHGLNLNDGFVAEGKVWFADAHIGGDFNCDKATFNGEKGSPSILFDGSRIEGRVYMRDGFRAKRGVHAQSTRIAGGMYCGSGIFERELYLAGARIDGDLGLAYATLDGNLIEHRDEEGKRTPPDTVSVNFNRLRVAGSLEWRELERTSDGEFVVHLAQAHVGYLNDQVDSWKGAQKILDGFTFDGIRISGKVNPGIVAWRHWGEFGWFLGKLRRWLEGKESNGALRTWLVKEDTSWVGKRRRWLAAQRGRWSAHPYDQVRAALRAAGQETAARTIAVERERRRRKQLRPGFDRLLNWTFGALLGHGYRPVFAVGWSMLIVALGSLYFADDPSEKAGKTPGPDFSPIGYSLDAFLPFDIGQVSSYVMTATGDNVVLWGMTTAGWLLAALVVGAVTGLLRKD